MSEQRGTESTRHNRSGGWASRRPEAPDLQGRLPGWRARWSAPGRVAAEVLEDQKLILFAPDRVTRRVQPALLDLIEAGLSDEGHPLCVPRPPLRVLPDGLAEVGAAGDGEHPVSLERRDPHAADAG